MRKFVDRIGTTRNWARSWIVVGCYFLTGLLVFPPEVFLAVLWVLVYGNIFFWSVIMGIDILFFEGRFR